METSGTNIQSALKGMLSAIERDNPEVVASTRVSQAWNMAANDAQRAHVDAVYTVPGTNAGKVVIYVDTGIWATELELQKEMIRYKMNLALQQIMQEEASNPHLDPEPIKNLRFAVSKERYRSKRADDVSVEEQLDTEDMHYQAEPVALSALEEEALRREVACIEDPALRDAAFNAMRADMELKKGM